MKRQFMQMKPSQGNGDPAQAAASQWPPAQPQPDPQSGITQTPLPPFQGSPQWAPVQPQSGIMYQPELQSGIMQTPLPPFQQAPGSPQVNAQGQGHLSGWQSGNLSNAQYPETGMAPPQKRPVTDSLVNERSLQGFFPGQSSSQQAGPNPANPPFSASPGGMPGSAPQWGQPVQPPASFAAPGAAPIQRGGPQSLPGSPMSPQPMVLPGPPPMQMPGGAQNGAGYYASVPSTPVRPTGPAYPGRPGPAPQNREYASGTFEQMGPPPTAAPPRWAPPKSPPPRKRRSLGRTLAGILLALLSFLLFAGGGAYWYYQTNFAASVDNITGKAAIHPTGSKISATSTPAVATNPNQNAMLTGNRVTIALFGSDTDGKGNDIQNGTPLAQTVIVVTIDPTTKYVGMASFPRDLQVTDPVSGGHPKLDEVFSYGYRGTTVADKIASAAGRTMDALEYNFGIHIDHYAWVGLTGFVKVIDTAGGVDVDAIHPMVDDVYPNDTNNPNGSIYDYKRLYIAPGPQHMNGLQALEYVRTRHSDLVGDFGRSARQQQILAQLKAKLATPDTILKAPQLLNDLQGAVQTDLTLDQIYPLANFARTIDTNKIDRVTFSPPYSKPSGANTNYLPICEQITPKIATMFALGVNAKCLPQVASSGNAATPAVASVAPTQSAATTQPTNATAAISLTNAWQIMGQLGSLSNMSLPQGSRGFAGTDSLHDLLDIMFLVVFESFDGMKV